MKKISLLTIALLSATAISISSAYAHGNERGSNNFGGGSSSCYKMVSGQCVTKQEYDNYTKYVNNTRNKINQNNQRFAQEYIYQNGRLKRLENGRYLAKENDVDFVNQEVVCSEKDFFIKGRTQCNACDLEYQNTLTGGYGGSTPYNNNIACSVLGKGNNSLNGHRVNMGSNFNPRAAFNIGSGNNNSNNTGNSGSGGSSSGGAGGGGGNLATKAFACLEYYTNSNGMTTGGEHLKYSVNMQYCQEPMTYYYNSLESYYCTQAGCYYNSPATIQIRKMWLYTNPYIYIGNTMNQSDIIAQTRTSTSTYGSWKQVYVYPN